MLESDLDTWLFHTSALKRIKKVAGSKDAMKNLILKRVQFSSWTRTIDLVLTSKCDFGGSNRRKLID